MLTLQAAEELAEPEAEDGKEKGSRERAESLGDEESPTGLYRTSQCFLSIDLKFFSD